MACSQEIPVFINWSVHEMLVFITSTTAKAQAGLRIKMLVSRYSDTTRLIR